MSQPPNSDHRDSGLLPGPCNRNNSGVPRRQPQTVEHAAREQQSAVRPAAPPTPSRVGGAHCCAPPPLESDVPLVAASGSSKPREDPTPQPPYVALVQPPINGVPLQGHVLGSVHRHRRLTCPSVPTYPVLCLHRLTRLTSARLHGRALWPSIRPVIRKRPDGGPVTMLPLSCCLSATGVLFLGVLFPPRKSSSPHGRPACRPGGTTGP